MFKLVLEKAEEPEIKLPTSDGSSKKQESSRKTSTKLCLLPVPFCHEWLLWVSGGDQGNGDIMGCVPFSFVQQWQSIFFS